VVAGAALCAYEGPLGIGGAGATRWRDRLVNGIDNALGRRFSRFDRRYREFVSGSLRYIDVKGLATIGFYSSARIRDTGCPSRSTPQPGSGSTWSSTATANPGHPDWPDRSTPPTHPHSSTGPSNSARPRYTVGRDNPDARATIDTRPIPATSAATANRRGGSLRCGNNRANFTASTTSTPDRTYTHLNHTTAACQGYFVTKGAITWFESRTW